MYEVLNGLNKAELRLDPPRAVALAGRPHALNVPAGDKPRKEVAITLPHSSGQAALDPRVRRAVLPLERHSVRENEDILGRKVAEP